MSGEFLAGAALNLIGIFVGVGVAFWIFNAQQQDKFKDLLAINREIAERLARLEQGVASDSRHREEWFQRQIEQRLAIQEAKVTATNEATGELRQVLTSEMKALGIQDMAQAWADLEKRLEKVVSHIVEHSTSRVGEVYQSEDVVTAIESLPEVILEKLVATRGELFMASEPIPPFQGGLDQSGLQVLEELGICEILGEDGDRFRVMPRILPLLQKELGARLTSRALCKSNAEGNG